MTILRYISNGFETWMARIYSQIDFFEQIFLGSYVGWATHRLERTIYVEAALSIAISEWHHAEK